MAVFRIKGGTPLCGETTVQGSKNSVLPMMAASLLTRGEIVLQNCPALTDVTASCAILRSLGAQAAQEQDTVVIRADALHASSIPSVLMRTMRSSVLFLAPLLARQGMAEITLPGGCELGPRPIDLHLEALRALGAQVTAEGERVICRGTLRGGVIRLRYPSVGATENALMAAVSAEGVTTIHGAAQEPEIVDLARFLRAMGAQVAGEGTETIAVTGGAVLHDAAYSVMPDRIVAATWLCAAASAGGEIVLHDAQAAQLAPVLEVLRRAGAEIETEPSLIRLRAEQLTAPGTIVTAPYPGFPTDAQAPMMAALLRVEGQTELRETVFAARFSHVPELRKLGAQISISSQTAIVTGTAVLHGAVLQAHDLRGGAAAVVGALGAEGESWVLGSEHLDRGYADLAGDLTALGAQVQRLENSTQIQSMGEP